MHESNQSTANLSVLMSVYSKETPDHLQECFSSLLEQTVAANEWVVVEDGPLTEELNETLSAFEQSNPGLIVRVPLERNQGLGLALREGILHCSNELVARMDTDDIAVKTRFERQLAMFANDPSLDICGGQIAEFDKNPDIIVAYRNVPTEHEKIVSYQKWRSAFNHMSVMYKRAAVLKAGNYEDAPLMEDDVLWAHLITTGAHCGNCNEVLVNVRADDKMIDRRGTVSYLRKYISGRKKMRQCGFISTWQLLGSVAIQAIVALMPHNARKTVFRTVLRSKEREANIG